jgi:hypothetical protein
MAIFSEPSDFALYRDLVAERLKLHGVVCSAYCLIQIMCILADTDPSRCSERIGQFCPVGWRSPSPLHGFRQRGRERRATCFRDGLAASR